MAKSTIGLRLSEETKSRLEALGKARDRTSHYLMKVAVERFLDLEESREAERELTRSRWKEFELTGVTVDHSDVRTWAASLKTASKSESG